jgi:hypothetical protein
MGKKFGIRSSSPSGHNLALFAAPPSVPGTALTAEHPPVISTGQRHPATAHVHDGRHAARDLRWRPSLGASIQKHRTWIKNSRGEIISGTFTVANTFCCEPIHRPKTGISPRPGTPLGTYRTARKCQCPGSDISVNFDPRIDLPDEKYREIR